MYAHAQVVTDVLCFMAREVRHPTECFEPGSDLNRTALKHGDLPAQPQTTMWVTARIFTGATNTEN